ncbi:unnamed protein product [Adineta steineri]|uniref:Palmitoyltransferase n=1 Tax=Adineta steineri TaxID=433720 RepID=A0A818VVP7_9BILA|nr:unnamed protein product [Adineta steineri]CAF3716696.1 unnamed protein product [Adineta steineri]
MASTTPPGLAKDYQNLASQYPLCKKCSMHKPPRTHHCRWCDAWLNSCVGFYNHRYFFQFCCFMAIGCMYAGTMGFREYQIARLGEHRFSHLDIFFQPFIVLNAFGIINYITYSIFIAALIVSFLLITLVCWHGRMISRGITSVERLFNQDYTKQCTKQGFVFVNPYDLGLVENWKQFFNVRTLGEFIRHVLWPSTHLPSGNGIIWTNCNGQNLNKQTKSSSQTRTDSKQDIQLKEPMESMKDC